ncbi:hypothetical protein Pan189_37730 [Stratiformator vulcanicus]|uniref:Uncharacterized protein n=1 Tax=Stratiformator vulcanicus TaxID=2527980 RepID=A0A517R642_9PLAN|nr:hypothetical protein Pan189_37730 [Stratiformator vulcanicus]
MRALATLLATLLSLCLGCSPNSDAPGVAPSSTTPPSTAADPGAVGWVTITNNNYGSMGSETGTAPDGSDTYKYKVVRAHFGDLLQDIAETTETSVSCSDATKLDMGVTLTFEGATAADLVADLAGQLNLAVSEDPPGNFVLSSQ